MKSRIPPKSVISNKQMHAADEYVRNQQQEVMRRFYKLIACILNQDFGFGTERLNKIFSKLETLSHEVNENPLFWNEVDDVVINHLKIQLPREDYEQMDKSSNCCKKKVTFHEALEAQKQLQAMKEFLKEGQNGRTN